MKNDDAGCKFQGIPGEADRNQRDTFKLLSIETEASV